MPFPSINPPQFPSNLSSKPLIFGGPIFKKMEGCMQMEEGSCLPYSDGVASAPLLNGQQFCRVIEEPRNHHVSSVIRDGLPATRP